MQLSFYFDQTRCTGCGACQVACKDWNDIPAGPEKWMEVLYTEKGKFPDVFVSYMLGTCWHCEEPVCMPACPVDAITKNESNGIVLVDSDTCIGGEECGHKCLKACPYNSPQFAAETDKMRKCNLCVDRWDEGKKPICVDGCPVRAMDAGEFGEMKAKYGEIQDADEFKYSGRTKPAVVFKPKEYKG